MLLISPSQIKANLILIWFITVFWEICCWFRIVFEVFLCLSFSKKLKWLQQVIPRHAFKRVVAFLYDIFLTLFFPELIQCQHYTGSNYWFSHPMTEQCKYLNAHYQGIALESSKCCNCCFEWQLELDSLLKLRNTQTWTPRIPAFCLVSCDLMKAFFFFFLFLSVFFSYPYITVKE